MKKIFVALLAAFLLIQLACSKTKSDDTEKLLSYTIVYLNSIWQKITVADVPGFSFTNKDGVVMKPGCACPPALEATTGKRTANNPEFAFFVKRGMVNNLLIFFMGGGACWNITNCAYNHTYSPALVESNLLLGLGVKGVLDNYGVGGIMDMSNPKNPFRDWTIVWVPYCTGDLGMGQNDKEYTDDYGTAYTSPVTIRHRGRVNLELVLQWLQANITTAPDKLFVTGSSAGSYATYLSYPLIRSVFNSTPKAYVLGDAGVGYAGVYDDGAGTIKKFMELVEPIWNLVLPLKDVSGSVFYNQTPSDYLYEYKNLVKAIVDYYSADRFAQYTTKWDKTQTWFYYIQKDKNIMYPDQWGPEESAPTFSIYSDEWNLGMKKPGGVGTGGAIDISAVGSNYWYYIGPGTHHTIDLLSAFYTETADGVTFLSWVDNFINDGVTPTSQDCTQAVCDQPN